MSGSRPSADGVWRATYLHLRALTLASVLGAAAVLLHRPDLAVLMTPFLAVGVWGWLARPSEHPHAELVDRHVTVREGQTVALRLRISQARGAHSVATRPATEAGATTLPAWDPRSLAGGVDGSGRAELTMVGVASHWGTARIGTGPVHLRSAWAAWDWTWRSAVPASVTVLPQVGGVTPAAALTGKGLAPGAHLARSLGEGEEPAGVRELRAGDRLARIHWAASARTGTLQVRETYAQRDTDVRVLVDATGDLPGGQGDGSLDRSVRAAALVARQVLAGGDRVGLQVLGSAGRPVPVSGGARQLRRVETALARAVAGSASVVGTGRDTTAGERGLPRGERGLPWLVRGRGVRGHLVVICSPLTAPEVSAVALECAGRGATVVVLDTAPPAPVSSVSLTAGSDGVARLRPVGWARGGRRSAAPREGRGAQERARLLLEEERQRTRERLEAAGVVVQPWSGPQALTQAVSAVRRPRRSGAAVAPRSGRPRPAQPEDASRAGDVLRARARRVGGPGLPGLSGLPRRSRRLGRAGLPGRDGARQRQVPRPGAWQVSHAQLAVRAAGALAVVAAAMAIGTMPLLLAALAATVAWAAVEPDGPAAPVSALVAAVAWLFGQRGLDWQVLILAWALLAQHASLAAASPAPAEAYLPVSALRRTALQAGGLAMLTAAVWLALRAATRTAGQGLPVALIVPVGALSALAVLAAVATGQVRLPGRERTG